MTLDPVFVLTNRIYEQNASAMRQRIGRRLREAEAQQAWLQAAEQARYEIAQQQQIEAIGAAVDQAYGPLMQCEQAHEAATDTALADLERGARELTIEFSDQHDDMMQWRWSIGDISL